MRLEERSSQNFKAVAALALVDGEGAALPHACRSLHINYPALSPPSMPAYVRALEGLDSQYTYYGRAAKFPASRSRSGREEAHWQGSNRCQEVRREAGGKLWSGV